MHSIPLLMAWLALQVPDFLREPGYEVIRHGDGWAVQKPGVGGRQPLTLSKHPNRNAAELRRKSLPLLRLNGLFVRFDPATYARSVIADWTDQEDARHIETDVREIVSRFAPAEVRALLQSTPVYMARLSGATGHTAEESTDHGRFVIYVDPFRATGRLHAASTLLHELTHLERYRARGFHANRAAAVLTKEDFVLLGLADEFTAFQAEANLVRSFLDSHAREDLRRAARDAFRDPELNWPLAVTVMLGFEGPPDEARRMMEARRHVVQDVKRRAGTYWDARHADMINPMLRQTIRTWYQHSREWKQFSAQRRTWRNAEHGLRRPAL